MNIVAKESKFICSYCCESPTKRMPRKEEPRGLFSGGRYTVLDSRENTASNKTVGAVKPGMNKALRAAQVWKRQNHDIREKVAYTSSDI
jgi:hypothetical protein